MGFEWSFRLGDLVAVLGFMGGGLAGAFMLGRNVDRVVMRVDLLESKLDRQSEEIGKLGELINLMGRYEERFAGVRRELDDLKRGRGFIVDEQPPHSPPRRSG